MTEDDKEPAKDSLKKNRGIDIETARPHRVRQQDVEAGRETLDAIREQGRRSREHGSDCFVPAVNITGAEEFTKDDAERLKGEDYTLNQTFRSKVETKAGTLL
jgi:hypothetical protein